MSENPANSPASVVRNGQHGQPPSPGLTVGDIYHVLFRHKGKIALISLAGLVAALVLYKTSPILYQSQAKLLVRYVVEAKTPKAPGTDDSRIKSPDSRGDSIISTELEILTSYDLAQQVAQLVGPEKILAQAGGGTNLAAATGLIMKGLSVKVPWGSTVIQITFQHPDPALVQSLLSQLVDTYLRKQAEIHRAVGIFDDFLAQQTDQVRSRLTQTEDALRQAKAKAGVISLDDSMKMYTGQIARIKDDIFSAEAELAERQAAMAALEKPVAGKVSKPTNSVQTASLTNDVKAAGLTNQIKAVTPTNEIRTAAVTNNVKPPLLSNDVAKATTNEFTVPFAKVAEYLRVIALLELLGKREQELVLQFTGESSLVKGVHAQIEDAEKRRQRLVDENPGLLVSRTSQAPARDPDSRQVTPGIDPADAEMARLSQTAEVNRLAALNTETTRVTALEAKIKVLNSQLDKLQKEATTLDNMEDSISQLQRKKELEEAHYKYFSASLEQTRIDEALGAGQVSNITKIQAPTPPSMISSKDLKTVAKVFLAGLAGAVGLAFGIEIFLDRSLKRPSDVESGLGLPLFLTVPVLASPGKSRLRNKAHPLALPLQTANKTGATDPKDVTAASAEGAVVVPWEMSHVWQPFYEALRDRLIFHFEVRNFTHKPKLVAVTSCAEGAGVTTLAAGLASSLSETGDGNVLLVDMNVEHGAAHHFYRGGLACGLDAALENGTRDTALVHDNLYVVSESTAAEATNGSKASRALPKRFAHLAPKLKASDYDYIIFDMPPVNQLTVTSKLARFMDIVLLVVESEKTDRDLVKRASGLLAESKTALGVVLNKRRNYVPRRLQQQL